MTPATKSKDAPAAAPTKDAAPSNPLTAALAQADQVAPRKEVGELIAGPFAVGNIGECEVRTVTRGTAEYTNAVFTPTGGGKTQRMPLAAVAVFARELGA